MVTNKLDKLAYSLPGTRLPIFSLALLAQERAVACATRKAQQSHFNLADATEHTAAWSNNPPHKGLIETAEGELMMPEDLYHDYAGEFGNR